MSKPKAQEAICSTEEVRVLSIQSHVVSGYVGNKAATFPLQLHGFDVDAINSVQFSNHKGYKKCYGQVLQSGHLEELCRGLKDNSLDNYSHLLTGYIGNVDVLKKIANLALELKRTWKSLIYLCDPVLGDNGSMYVPKELLPIYQSKVIPLADILTPNQFEAEMLTGVTISDSVTAMLAMSKLHAMGAETVVISSVHVPGDPNLIIYASQLGSGKEKITLSLIIPQLKSKFSGTGDLFAALLLVWLHKHPQNFKVALEKAVSSIQAILANTIKYYSDKSLDKPIEMRIIQSQSDLLDPKVVLTAQIL